MKIIRNCNEFEIFYFNTLLDGEYAVINAGNGDCKFVFIKCKDNVISFECNHGWEDSIEFDVEIDYEENESRNRILIR